MHDLHGRGRGLLLVYSLRCYEKKSLHVARRISTPPTCNAVMAASFSVMTQWRRSFSSAMPPKDALLDVLLPIPILQYQGGKRQDTPPSRHKTCTLFICTLLVGSTVRNSNMYLIGWRYYTLLKYVPFWLEEPHLIQIYLKTWNCPLFQNVTYWLKVRLYYCLYFFHRSSQQLYCIMLNPWPTLRHRSNQCAYCSLSVVLSTHK